MTNDGSLDTLKVTWKGPPGNLDFYNVTLFHLGSVKERKSLESHVTGTSFNKLVPGRLYQVDVNTVSGELFTEATAYGRTGTFLQFSNQKHFHVFHLLPSI